MSSDDLCFLSALQLREHYRSRTLSPVEVLEAVLDRTDRVEPDINAFITRTPDLARKQARAAEQAFARGEDARPLLGIPFSIKDLTATKDIRTTMGSLLHKDWVPDYDAPLVERSYAAGGVMLGKTNTSEMGWKAESGNRVCGPTYNPWKAGLTAGGSSGGAGAAVATGIGPLAQGSDAGGSIRVPSSFCGVYGLKPSFGMIPQYPAIGGMPVVHNGPIARTVRDAALFLNVLAGPDARDPSSLNSTGIDYLEACNQPVDGLHVAWSPDLGYAQVDPEVAELTENAARVFGDLGCHVEQVDPGIPDPHEALAPAWFAPQAATLRDNFEAVKPLLDPGRVPGIEHGFTISGIDLASALSERITYYEAWRKLMERFDFLLTPTVAVTAFRAGDDNASYSDGTPMEFQVWNPFTKPFNFTGQPAATVPCGFTSEGLPVGLQIVGRWRDDVTVLAASAAFESLRPWAQNIPPVVPGA
jgi:aspartyl-tRNA(Asn)/glutamyl-tRNA(Gln) amidotransferase subunit A